MLRNAKILARGLLASTLTVSIIYQFLNSNRSLIADYEFIWCRIEFFLVLVALDVFFLSAKSNDVFFSCRESGEPYFELSPISAAFAFAIFVAKQTVAVYTFFIFPFLARLIFNKAIAGTHTHRNVFPLGSIEEMYFSPQGYLIMAISILALLYLAASLLILLDSPSDEFPVSNPFVRVPFRILVGISSLAIGLLIVVSLVVVFLGNPILFFLAMIGVIVAFVPYLMGLILSVGSSFFLVLLAAKVWDFFWKEPVEQK